MTGADSQEIPARHAESHRPSGKVYPSKDLVERRRRHTTMLFGICVALLLLGTESRWPAKGVADEALFMVGVSLAAIGALGRTWCHLFISGYKSKVLIQVGPYSMCRNPLYFFSAVGMVGIGLCSGTLTIPLVLAICFAAYYPLIIKREQVRLLAIHNQDFQDYCSRTPAFWPQRLAYREPESYSMIPRAVRRHIFDAFWFVALAALTHVVADLHETDVLPAFLKLW